MVALCYSLMYSLKFDTNRQGDWHVEIHIQKKSFFEGIYVFRVWGLLRASPVSQDSAVSGGSVGDYSAPQK